MIKDLENLKKYKHFYVDVETTSTSRVYGKIVQIAIKIGSFTFSKYIKHDVYNWNEKTLSFHRSINKDILNKIEEDGISINELEFYLKEFFFHIGIKESDLKEYVLVAHNSHFDKSFIDHLPNNISRLFPEKTADTLKISHYFFKKKLPNFRLSTIVKNLGEYVEEKFLHEAKYDLMLLELLANKLMYFNPPQRLFTVENEKKKHKDMYDKIESFICDISNVYEKYPNGYYHENWYIKEEVFVNELLKHIPSNKVFDFEVDKIRLSNAKKIKKIIPFITEELLNFVFEKIKRQEITND